MRDSNSDEHADVQREAVAGSEKSLTADWVRRAEGDARQKAREYIARHIPPPMDVAVIDPGDDSVLALYVGAVGPLLKRIDSGLPIAVTDTGQVVSPHDPPPMEVALLQGTRGEPRSRFEVRAQRLTVPHSARRMFSTARLSGFFNQRHVTRPLDVGQPVDRHLGHALFAIHRIAHSRAWNSPVLESTRVQLDLGSEVRQVVEFSQLLNELREKIGGRPDALGVTAQQLWEKRVEVYEYGVRSLVTRSEQLVVLARSVEEISTKVAQMERLVDGETEDLLAELLESVASSEFATDHIQDLQGHAGGAAELLGADLALVHTSASSLAAETFAPLE